MQEQELPQDGAKVTGILEIIFSATLLFHSKEWASQREWLFTGVGVSRVLGEPTPPDAQASVPLCAHTHLHLCKHTNRSNFPSVVSLTFRTKLNIIPIEGIPLVSEKQWCLMFFSGYQTLYRLIVQDDEGLEKCFQWW